MVEGRYSPLPLPVSCTSVPVAAILAGGAGGPRVSCLFHIPCVCEIMSTIHSSQPPPTPYSRLPKKDGLYDPRFEHDSCGVSFVANIKGKASHDIVATALGSLCNLEHRGATGAEANTGDGA